MAGTILDESTIPVIRGRFAGGLLASAAAPLSFRADTGDDRVRATFGAGKYARPVALEDGYDPENLFRLDQNVEPS